MKAIKKFQKSSTKVVLFISSAKFFPLYPKIRYDRLPYCSRLFMPKKAKRRTSDRSHLLDSYVHWSMVFASNITTTGRRFRIFALIDGVSRDCIALEVDTSINRQQITRYLSEAMIFRPKETLFDNGSVFTPVTLNA